MKKSGSGKKLKQTNSKLNQIAKTLEIDSKIKKAEEAVLGQRRMDLKKLRAIKSYLTGIKTSERAKVYQNSARNSNTQYK